MKFEEIRPMKRASTSKPRVLLLIVQTKSIPQKIVNSPRMPSTTYKVPTERISSYASSVTTANNNHLKRPKISSKYSPEELAPLAAHSVIPMTKFSPLL